MKCSTWWQLAGVRTEENDHKHNGTTVLGVARRPNGGILVSLGCVEEVGEAKWLALDNAAIKTPQKNRSI